MLLFYNKIIQYESKGEILLCSWHEMFVHTAPVCGYMNIGTNGLITSSYNSGKYSLFSNPITRQRKEMV